MIDWFRFDVDTMTIYRILEYVLFLVRLTSVAAAAWGAYLTDRNVRDALLDVWLADTDRRKIVAQSLLRDEQDMMFVLIVLLVVGVVSMIAPLPLPPPDSVTLEISLFVTRVGLTAAALRLAFRARRTIQRREALGLLPIKREDLIRIAQMAQARAGEAQAHAKTKQDEAAGALKDVDDDVR